MNCAHHSLHLLSVQPERQQTTHQCCLEGAACCQDMAGYLHYQQKEIDAVELKTHDGIFGAGVVTPIPAYI